MRKSQLRSCLRCDEPVHSEPGSLYRCQTCGFIEEGMSTYTDSIDCLQDERERTFDLVEIFNLISPKKKFKGP